MDLGLNFRYEVDKSSFNYMHNWFTEYDLMCKETTSVNSATSMHYVGFGLGILLVPTPDIFGRKRTMNFVLIGYLIVATTSLLAPQLWLKGVSYFL